MDNGAPVPAHPVPSGGAHRQSLRKWWLAGLTVVFLLAAVAAGCWWWRYARFYQSTDDAYVSGNLVQLTPQISGIVTDIQRLDLRMVATLAFLIFAAISFWNAHFDVDVDFRGIAIPRFIQGAALACFFVPLITMAFSGLPPSRLASASGLLNALRTVGGGFGTSLSITLWDRRESFHRSRLAEHVTAFNPDVLHRLDEIRAAGVPDPSA